LTRFFRRFADESSGSSGHETPGSGLLLHISSGAGRLAIPGMGCTARASLALEALAEVYRTNWLRRNRPVVIEPGAYGHIRDREAGTRRRPGRKSSYGEMALVPEKIVSAADKLAREPSGNRRFCAASHRNAGRKERFVSRRTGRARGAENNAVTDDVQVQVLEAFGVTGWRNLRKQSSVGS